LNQLNEVVDLRSDTLTRPGEAMRRAIAEAVVGDDVHGEDPTALRLQELAAELVGHEAALFVPTGTMGNQIAINVHTTPGSDVILEEGTHVYQYEMGAMAAWSGALPRVLVGSDGRLEPEQVRQALRPEAYDLARATLLVLENSHNHAGGTLLEVEQTRALAGLAHERGLRVHLDGARVFNAATALGVAPSEVGAPLDSVMFCLSKGLGAPVGSMLCGSADFIREARIVRKRMGGGMRQVGVLAAAGLYALEHNVRRLEQDHQRAARLAQALAESPRFRIDPALVRTNIVVAAVEPEHEQEAVLTRLREAGVLALGMGPGRVRFVTHLDVSEAGIDRAVDVLRRF